MSGWRKSDSKSNPKPEVSRPSSAKTDTTNTDTAQTGASSPNSTPGAWRKGGASSNTSATAQKKTGWRGSRGTDTAARPPSKRRWLLVAVGLLFIFFAVWFVDLLRKREQIIEVVLYQRGVDSSEIETTPIALMPLAQQWAKVDRNNCRVSYFHQYKDHERKSPLLLVVQSEVDASQPRNALQEVLKECLAKIRDNTTAIVVLDLYSTPSTIPLLNYSDPARGVGQYTDYYEEVVAVWEEMLQAAEVKASRKNLVLLVANSTKNAQAWGAPELNGSVLQSFVIDALSNPECDTNGDYAVTLAELEAFVGQRVADWVRARRAAIQTPKLLLQNDAQRESILYRRVSDNWVNRFIGKRRKLASSANVAVTGNGIESVQKNWNKIDFLWSEYESLLSKKVYRWAPERMMRIAHGLTTLEHFAERVDIEKQASASRLLRTVELEIQACPKYPPSRIDFDALGIEKSGPEDSQNRYDVWAKWTADLPRYLEAKPQENVPDATDSAGNAKEAKSSTEKEAASGDTSATDDTKFDATTKPNFTGVDRRFLVWRAARQFPIAGDPNGFRRFLDLGLSDVDFSSPAPALHFLSLFRNDSYWYKSNTTWDTPTKTRFGQTLARSLNVLGLWMRLVFVERRPDAVIKLSTLLDSVSVDVQNQIVDSWLVGELPSDELLADLEARLTELEQSLITWEAAYDARDEYYLSRPYFVCWLAAASEFADSSEQASLERLSEKIKQFDEALGSFGKTADQNYATQLIERWRTVRDEYRRLSLSKLPADGSMPSEESFVWLRITRGLPVALDEDGRRSLRSKMVEYISGKADIEVGKGDSEGKGDEKSRKVANDKRAGFINDLAGKFPLDTIVRLGEMPKDDITSQSRWLRSPLSLLYQAVYQQPSQAISAPDNGAAIWHTLVEQHSKWLQELVVQRVTWGNGSNGVELTPFYQRLAQACRIAGNGTNSTENGADETSESAQRLKSLVQEVEEALKQFRFDVNGNTKFTYNPSELPSGGLQYPIKLMGTQLATWGSVRELSCWVDAGSRSQPVAAFQGDLAGENPYSFSMSDYIDSGIQGELVGSFRGNQFGQPLVIKPESRTSVASDLLRNTTPGKLIVQGVNAPKLNVVFAIDVSGSMNQAPPTAEKELGSRLGQAKEIMNESIDLLTKEYLQTGIVGQVKVGLVLFNGNVKPQALVDIREFRPIFPDEGDGETRLVDGYETAIDMLTKMTDEECLVIGITDGMDTSDGGGMQAKDVNAFLRDKIQRSKHIQCLLLQAASKQTFVKEMVDSITDTEKYSVSGTESHWSSQWDKAQASLASLQQNSGGRFIWYKEDEINSKNMMDQINRILPGTEVVVEGTLDIEDRNIPLSQFATLPNAMLQKNSPTKESDVLRQWSEGIGGWSVVVQQRNRRLQGDDSNRRGITGKYGPFPVWGGENVRLIFDQRNGSLYRKDNDVRPETYKDMWGEQWISPRLLEGRDGVSVSIDFGCEATRPVDRPELIFVEQIQNGNQLPTLSDFVYKLSFSAQHSASFVETCEHWVKRKTPTEKVRMDHRIWTVRRSKSLSHYFLPTIEPISESSNDNSPLKLGDSWKDQKPPEVKVRRMLAPDNKKERLQISLRGETSSEWFVAAVGNVWRDVNVEIATDRTWVEKTYTIADGFAGQPLQVVLVSAEQLRQAVEESASRGDGAVELFEFESLLESSR